MSTKNLVKSNSSQNCEVWSSFMTSSLEKDGAGFWSVRALDCSDEPRPLKFGDPIPEENLSRSLRHVS